MKYLIILILLSVLLVGCNTTRPAVRRMKYHQPNALLQVKPNAYGMGVGSNQFGGPVTYQPWGQAE